MDQKLRETVLSKAAGVLVFRTGPTHAATLEPFFTPALNRQELERLPNFHCAAGILANGTPFLPAFVMATDPLPPPLTDCIPAEMLVDVSRQHFARPRAAVGTEILARGSAG